MRRVSSCVWEGPEVGKRLFSVMADSISTYEGCNPDGYAVFFDETRAARSGLTGPQDTWWARVIRHFDGELLANASFSGSMMEGAGFPAGESARRARDLCPGGAQPTDVIVFLGTNDYGWGSARAQVAARSTATPPDSDFEHIAPATAGATDERGLAGFVRAYSRALDNVYACAPQARVWCVSLLPGRLQGACCPTFCWNLRGVEMMRYNDAIRACAQAHGCAYVDACGFGLDYEAVDGTHPTARGMRQMASLVIAAMEGRDASGATIAEGYPPDEGGAAKWASRVLCADRSCVGCSHARSTGNDWSCVCERQL